MKKIEITQAGRGRRKNYGIGNWHGRKGQESLISTVRSSLIYFCHFVSMSWCLIFVFLDGEVFSGLLASPREVSFFSRKIKKAFQEKIHKRELFNETF